MRTTFITAGMLTAAVVVSLHAQQQQPVFRGGVDVISVDVAALDKSGAPVTGLVPDDFMVVAGKKPRRVISADFVSSLRTTRSAANRLVPSASSNLRSATPRTWIFVVDTDQIPSGGGRVAMKTIGDYIDRLGPEDRVGVMTLSDRRAPPTVDRQVVREAFAKLVGTSVRLRDKDMTFGEAPGISQRDTTALKAYWYRIADQGPAMPGDRSCGAPASLDRVTSVPQSCVEQAEFTLERARMHTRRVLTRLSTIADAMSGGVDSKSIVLVSGGMVSDLHTREDFAQFGTLTSRTRVSVHALLIEAEASATGSNSAETRRLDSAVGFGGLSDVADSSRGSVQRVLGDAATAMGRLDRELSGYYVLAVERDAVDRDGATTDVEVRTTKPGVSLRARKSLTPTKPNAFASTPASDPKTAIGELLKSSTPVSQIPMDVDVFALPVSSTGGETRAVIAIETGRAPQDVKAFGFIVADANGKLIGDGYEAPPPFLEKGKGRSLFIVQAPLQVGRFMARFAIIDSQGRQGSLQHSFDVAPWPSGVVRLSDIILGSGRGETFGPAATISSTEPVAARLVVRDSSSKFENVRVRASITRASDDAPIETMDVPLQPSGDPLRRFADCEVRVDSYPPGEYVVAMTVMTGTTEVGQKRRVFVR